MTEVLTRYAAGADVPEWLVAVEPMNSEANFEGLRFTSEALVIDLPDFYLVVGPDPRVSPPSMLISGGMNRVYAASKAVHFAQGVSGLFPIDVNAWGWVPQRPYPPAPAVDNSHALAEQAGAVQAQAALLRDYRLQQARPGLLARLWAAWKG